MKKSYRSYRINKNNYQDFNDSDEKPVDKKSLAYWGRLLDFGYLGYGTRYLKSNLAALILYAWLVFRLLYFIYWLIKKFIFPLVVLVATKLINPVALGTYKWIKQKFLEVSEPFFKKVLTRRRQKE